jgi:hypothetical protein
MAYKNAKANTPHTARMAHDQALSKVMQMVLKEDAQVYIQFVENESFKRFLSDMVYDITSTPTHPSRYAPLLRWCEQIDKAGKSFATSSMIDASRLPGLVQA